jgi:hypothetical protein
MTLAVLLLISMMLGAQPTIHAAEHSTAQTSPANGDWRSDFHLDQRSFVTRGANRYFALIPHFCLVLEAPGAKLMITVLDDTLSVGGVMTRVVEEREWEDGKLSEVSRNYYAMDRATRDIFYFGEDVIRYVDGKPQPGEDSWHAGEKGAHAGLMMPGTPSVGMKYYQEFAPKLALDRAEIASLDDTLKTPAGSYQNCLRTRESSGLNPQEEEFKTYAPDIGLVQDENLLLIRYGFCK